jgi:Tol biopolymer transport system component
VILTPAVSADGKRIAYQTGQVEWNVLEISVPSGTVRTTMTGSGIIAWWPDWAPSGTRYLVNTDRSGTLAIEDVSAADGFSRRLVASPPGEFVMSPRWSPDGTRFTFSVGGAGGSLKLMLANASGGSPTRLDTQTPSGVRSMRTAWSPDSQWVAFRRGDASKEEVVKMRPGAASSLQVLAEFTSADAPSWNNYPPVEWSPAGDWIVHSRREGLFIVSPDGKTTRKLTERKLQAYGFSKDGSQLFGILRNTTGEGPQWQLYSVYMRTGADRFLAPVDLPPSADSLAGFSLHPDGTRFLTSIAKWPFDIWMMEGFDTSPSPWRRFFRRQ